MDRVRAASSVILWMWIGLSDSYPSIHVYVHVHEHVAGELRPRPPQRGFDRKDTAQRCELSFWSINVTNSRPVRRGLISPAHVAIATRELSQDALSAQIAIR